MLAQPLLPLLPGLLLGAVEATVLDPRVEEGRGFLDQTDLFGSWGSDA